jgi:hypothetical protein
MAVELTVSLLAVAVPLIAVLLCNVVTFPIVNALPVAFAVALPDAVAVPEACVTVPVS